MAVCSALVHMRMPAVVSASTCERRSWGLRWRITRPRCSSLSSKVARLGGDTLMALDRRFWLMSGLAFNRLRTVKSTGRSSNLAMRFSNSGMMVMQARRQLQPTRLSSNCWSSAPCCVVSSSESKSAGFLGSMVVQVGGGKRQAVCQATLDDAAELVDLREHKGEMIARGIPLAAVVGRVRRQRRQGAPARPQPHPAQRHMAGQAQHLVGHEVGQRGRVGGGCSDRTRQGAQFIHSLAQQSRFMAQYRGIIGVSAHQRQEIRQPPSLVAQYLAHEEVDALDLIGPFIDHRDARIAQILLDATFHHITMAAKHLQGLAGALETLLRQEGLDDRRDEFQPLVMTTAQRGIGIVLGQVQQQAGPAGQHARAFDAAALFHQQFLYGRMMGDQVTPRHRGSARGRARLAALAGIGGGPLPCRLRQPQPLRAHMQARRIHHHEHGGQSASRLAHQPALCLLEAQAAGGAAMDPHLVFDTRAPHAITAAIGQHPWRQQQRQALAAGQRIGQACQHQVDDVVGEIVLATGDEDLVAADAVAAILLRQGACAQLPQVAAGLGFGQAHGGQPLAAGDLLQVARLQLGRTMRGQAGIGAMQQARIHGPAMVGGAEHFIEDAIEDMRQALAAVLRRAGKGRPASVAELRIGAGKTGGRMHRAVVEATAFAVTAGVQGRDDLGGEAAGFFQHLGHQGAVELGMRGQAAQDLRGLQDFIEDEGKVTQRRGIRHHRSRRTQLSRQASYTTALPRRMAQPTPMARLSQSYFLLAVSKLMNRRKVQRAGSTGLPWATSAITSGGPQRTPRVCRQTSSPSSSFNRQRVSMMARPSAVTVCQSAPLLRISPLSSGPLKLPPVMGMMRRRPRSEVLPSSQIGATRSTEKRARKASLGCGGTSAVLSASLAAWAWKDSVSAASSRNSFFIVVSSLWSLLFERRELPVRTGQWQRRVSKTQQSCSAGESSIRPCGPTQSERQSIRELISLMFFCHGMVQKTSRLRTSPPPRLPLSCQSPGKPGSPVDRRPAGLILPAW
eukprot:TRINITY_DN997_c0_g3_i1.p1 TRINITY_DN997_c0_g3~~TRINITY_DN997_c0_g3_i1.p1  ORF type:complete len:1016 (+),score=293.40 TRINITY_DN997_c0_g3_i1:1785-4832(+)